MQVIYAHQEAPETIISSIFLAGPTPRDKTTPSWRPEAIALLRELGYDGTVFVPEQESGDWKANYDDQVEWEERHLRMADVIIFWVPRELSKMPAFTTNIEWGVWHDSGKAIFGAPKNAPKNSYLRYYAKKLGIPEADTLESTLTLALERIGSGAARTGGERFIPLFMWHTPHFRSWYEAQKNAGNRIDDAKVIATFFYGKGHRELWMWSLHVDIFVANEDRHKTNEIVIARPDIATVLLYKKGGAWGDTRVVLVREFRANASTSDAMILEFPGGSSTDPTLTPRENAAEEVREEAGLSVDASRLVAHGVRQLAGTFSAHKAHLFSLELSDSEMREAEKMTQVSHGDPHMSERTEVLIMTAQELLDSPLPDWTTLGMLLAVLGPNDVS